MARAKKAAGIGHNSGDLTDEQRRKLFIQHKDKIARARDAVASESGKLRGLYKVAKSEGFTKKDIDFALSLEKDSAEAQDRRRREDEIARWMNHPIGTQSSLFDETGIAPERTTAEAALEAIEADEGGMDALEDAERDVGASA